MALALVGEAGVTLVLQVQYFQPQARLLETFLYRAVMNDALIIISVESMWEPCSSLLNGWGSAPGALGREHSTLCPFLRAEAVTVQAVPTCVQACESKSLGSDSPSDSICRNGCLKVECNERMGPRIPEQ